jgi:hypothetical protein
MQDWREEYDAYIGIINMSDEAKAGLKHFFTVRMAERDAEWREAVALERGERTTGCLMKKDCDCGEVFFIQGRNATIDELNERISKL